MSKRWNLYPDCPGYWWVKHNGKAQIVYVIRDRPEQRCSKYFEFGSDKAKRIEHIFGLWAPVGRPPVDNDEDLPSWMK